LGREWACDGLRPADQWRPIGFRFTSNGAPIAGEEFYEVERGRTREAGGTPARRMLTGETLRQPDEVGRHWFAPVGVHSKRQLEDKSVRKFVLLVEHFARFRGTASLVIAKRANTAIVCNGSKGRRTRG